MRDILKNIVLFLIGLFLSLVILELFLRVHNFFPTRLKGNEIILPVNKRFIIKNNTISKLDKTIVHTKNSLGFRGEDVPRNFESYLSIIAVGGSTTECFFLSDEKTWPYLLGQKLKKTYTKIWINNAGLDGHSTFGHIILLRDYLVKIKPKIILFLIGVNDIAMDSLGRNDKIYLRNRYISWKDWLKKNSEVISLFVNIARSLDAHRKGLCHSNLELAECIILEISKETINKEVEKYRSHYIESYKKRLLQLIIICMESNIKPVFITQPIVCGNKLDPLTGVNLETVKYSDSMNGKLYWEVLELYNNATKEVAKDANTFFIDLANELDKNSLYFYDWYHLTNEGSEKVADILCRALKNYLDNNYKDFAK